MKTVETDGAFMIDHSTVLEGQTIAILQQLSKCGISLLPRLPPHHQARAIVVCSATMRDNWDDTVRTK